MKPLKLLRTIVCLLSLLWAGTAAAQLRDVEYATPRVPVSPVATSAGSGAETYSPEQCAQLLHELTTTLQLQPYQVLVLRRTLAAQLLPANSPWTVAENSPFQTPATPNQELRKVLTEAQLARLRQWETSQPGSRYVSWIASLQ